MNTFGIIDYTNYTPKSVACGQMDGQSGPATIPAFAKRKNEKIFIKCAHLECVNNQYVKFEYKGMKTVKLQITQTRHRISIFVRKNI